MNFKKICILVLALVMVFCLFGCGKDANAPDDSGKPSDNKPSSSQGNDNQSGDGARTDITVAISGYPTMWSSNFSTNQLFCMEQVYSTLVDSMSGYPWGSEGIKPEIAESWEITDGGKTYTFKIRDDVYFHNGDKLTAEDCAFSYNEIWKNDGLFSKFLVNFDYAEATDDTTLVMHYTAPYPSTLNQLGYSGLAIFNKNYTLECLGDNFVSGVGHTADEFAGFAPVGTGCYKYVSSVEGESMQLTYFEDYFGEEPAIKDINVIVMADADAAILALEAGEVDILTNNVISSANAQLVQTLDDVTFVAQPCPGPKYTILNTNSDSPLNDKLVRQAIAYAVDYNALNLIGTGGYGSVMESLFEPAANAYPDNVSECFVYGVDAQPEKAKELLTQAGYPNGFTCKVITSGTWQPMYEAMLPYLDAVGITLEIEVQERATWLQNQQAGNFELCFCGMMLLSGDQDEVIYSLYHSTGASNYAKYSNAKVDELLEKARASSDINERIDLYAQVNEIVMDELPYLPHFGDVQVSAYNSALSGFETGDTWRNCPIENYSW